MKILITGMTPKQVGRARSNVITFVDALKNILDEIEEVEYDHRPIVPGEDISNYDKVIVFIAPHDSIAAGYRWGGLYALAARDDAILAADDWQYYTIQMKLTSALEAGRFYRFVDKFPNWSRKDELQGFEDHPKWKQAIQETAENLRWDIPFKTVLMPLFQWHSMSAIGWRLKDITKVTALDPSNFISLPPVNLEAIGNRLSNKRRVWVCGSLFNQSDFVHKMGFTWPVEMYGHKKTQPVLTERRLCQKYLESWGIVSPRYKTSGDGWWRARYVFASGFKNIMAMSNQEAAGMPDMFQNQSRVNIIESLDDKGLMSLASRQSMWLKENFEPRSQVISKIVEVLHE